MMTSRAEYRLLLRQDNADLRLREKGYEIGLITEEQYRALLMKKSLIEQEINRLKNVLIGASRKNQEFFESHNSATLKTGVSLAELMCRPELSYEILAEIDPERKELPADVIEQVEIEIKYEGYIERQLRQVEQFKKMEKKKIPSEINYDDIESLRLEARQKLKALKPVSVGQASRISGVSPANLYNDTESTIFLFSCLFLLSFDHLLCTETIPAFFKIASGNFARNHQKSFFFQFLIQLTDQLVSMTYRNTQHFCEFICSNINLVVFCHICILLFYSVVATFYIPIICSDFAIVKYFEMLVEKFFKTWYNVAISIHGGR